MSRKFLVILFIIALCNYHVSANDSTLIIKCEKELLKRVHTSYLNTSLFKNKIDTKNQFQIKVIDFRNDTDCIGTCSKKIDYFSIIKFDSNFSLKKLFYEFIKPIGDYNLIFVVKKFWIKDSITNYNEKEHLEETILTRSSNTDKYPENTVLLKLQVDCFLETKDEVMPFVRIDTSIINTYKNKESANNGINGKLITKAFTAIKEIIGDALSLRKYLSNKPISKVVFQDYLNNHGPLKIRLPQELTRGVYATFDELLNNKPSNKNFQFTIDNKTGITILYLKDEYGNWHLSRNSWGLFDGTNLWIGGGKSYHLIHKIKESYYWFPNKEVNEKITGVGIPNAGSYLGNGYPDLEFKIYSLDIRKTLSKLDLSTGMSY